MKIIFLDIDGVLAVMHKERDDYGSFFHEEFVTNLKSIIDQTDAKIVISSSWRHSGLKIIQEMWAKRNLPGEVIDSTPGIYGHKSTVQFYNDYLQQHPTPKTHSVGIPRGIEIEYWLKLIGNFTRINWSKDSQIEYINNSKVKNYVILDDDSDMLLCQYEHFVKTSNQTSPDAIQGYGLTKSAADMAIKILNTPIIDLYYPINNEK
jgi:hypothetical protein